MSVALCQQQINKINGKSLYLLQSAVLGSGLIPVGPGLFKKTPQLLGLFLALLELKDQKQTTSNKKLQP